MDFFVTILGASSAIPIYGRNQTSQVVTYGSKLYWVDCGEGAQIQALKYGIKIQKVNHIFISHLHGDHFFGLVGLISTMHLQGRSKTLNVYGPKGLDEIITLQLRYSHSFLNFEVVFHEVDTTKFQVLHSTHELDVFSIPLNHSIDCCGYLFQEKSKGVKIIKELLPKGIELEHYSLLREGKDIEIKGKIYKNSELTTPNDAPRSYAFCSDNRVYDGMENYLQNITLLYHEATFLHELIERAEITKHTTAKEIGQFAKKIATKKLIIGHFSARYKNLSPILAESNSEFANTILAEEGKIYEI